ncbi:MAG: hypothetical protein BroJett024_37850 [Alphaproteobacteria bacterium]|nr:MAG: hypothetical protein BroJett024_37850 [Alphaproteobacteria bacterium]
MAQTTSSLWLDELSPGRVFEGGPRRIGERDLLFCALWDGDGQPHSNEEYSRGTPFGRRIVHGDGTLAMGIGLIHGLGIFSDSLVGCESMEIKYPNPVYIGDSIRARLTIEAVEAVPGAPDGLVNGVLEIIRDGGEATAVHSRLTYRVRRRA